MRATFSYAVSRGSNEVRMYTHDIIMDFNTERHEQAVWYENNCSFHFMQFYVHPALQYIYNGTLANDHQETMDISSGTCSGSFARLCSNWSSRSARSESLLSLFHFSKSILDLFDSVCILCLLLVLARLSIVVSSIANHVEHSVPWRPRGTRGCLIALICLVVTGRPYSQASTIWSSSFLSLCWDISGSLSLDVAI